MSANIAPVFGALLPGVSNVAYMGAPLSAVFRLLRTHDGSYTLAGYTFEGGAPNQYDAPAFWGAGRIDGQLAGSLGSASALQFSGIAAASLQDDGKYLVAGSVQVGAQQYAIALARYNADGSLDAGFGSSAPVVVPSQLSEFANSVTVQPDGKIVIGGYSLSATGKADAVIARLDSDGAIDTTFDGTGQVVLSLDAGLDTTVATQAQPDGKLVALVRTSSQDPVIGHSFHLFRFNADGTPDAAFGSGAEVDQVISPIAGSSTTAVLVQADGKIVVAGVEVVGTGLDMKDSFFLVRFTPDGHLDSAFGVQGKASVAALPFSASAVPLNTIVEQPDGKLLIAAHWTDARTGHGSGFFRFNADGTLDSTFGNGGEAVAPGTHDFADFTQQADGTLVAAESLGIVTNTPQIVRFNADGTPDTVSAAANPFSLAVIADVHDKAVRLAPSASVFDAEDAAAGTYHGATLTIERHGGAVASDTFGAASTLQFDGWHLYYGLREYATMASSGGVLQVTFDTDGSAGVNVNSVLRGLTWSPAGQAAGTTVAFDWTFDDGSGAPNAQATGTSTVYVGDVFHGAVDPNTQAGLNDKLLATGPGQVLDGGDGNDFLQGNFADDVLVGGAGNDTLAGGPGTDVGWYNGPLENYRIAHQADGSFTVSGPDGTDVLTDVERLEFTDGRVALDVEGNAGKAYRLYQAAFDRLPDIGGLGYQMHDLDTGVSLEQVASNFIASPEFQRTYGNVDGTHFVTLLYQNVLHRAPDEGGLQFHLDELAHGQSRADILIHFSESPENQANVVGQIEDGMLYLP